MQITIILLQCPLDLHRLLLLDLHRLLLLELRQLLHLVGLPCSVRNLHLENLGPPLYNLAHLDSKPLNLHLEAVSFGSFTTIGAPSQLAFGTSSTPASGAICFSAFGATNTPAFGSPASPGLGASSPSLYGASSTPAKDSLTKQKNRRVMELVSESDSDSDDDCVIHPFVVLKNICDMRQYEESEECFVLDFDPYEATADLGSEKVMAEARENDEGVVVISEKGQVACRDYPHSRHHCVKFPYDKTLPESYCELCYCYVCDTAAPCKFWRLPVPGHCYASDHTADWKLRRETARLGKMKLK